VQCLTTSLNPGFWLLRAWIFSRKRDDTTQRLPAGYRSSKTRPAPSSSHLRQHAPITRLNVGVVKRHSFVETGLVAGRVKRMRTSFIIRINSERRKCFGANLTSWNLLPIIPGMDNFGVGFVSGVLSSALVAYLVELWARKRLHAAAKQLEGEWIAYDMLDGRTIDRSKPMKDSWPTRMIPKPAWRCFAADSHVLDISADHVSSDGSLRHHEGYLIIDRASPRLATRIVCYADSDEVSEQRIVISSSTGDPKKPDTLHVFPVPTVAPSIKYNRHALCKRGAVAPQTARNSV